MNDIVGVGPLARFALRRDRVRISVWIVSIVAMVGLTAEAIAGLFPTQADLDAAAAASTNPAILAFQGPAQSLDTLGGQIAFQIGAPGLVISALMGMLMMGRLTRGEEEAGRLELMRSLPVGRHAPGLVASLVVAGMSVALGALVALALIAQGLEAAGSLSFGLSYALMGLVFAGVGFVAAQVTENTRVAYGLAGAVLAASYVLRAIGDVGDGAVSWLSPIGWMQKARPFAGERWWPFVIPVVAIVALYALGRAMAARRDLGAGLVAPRPGPPGASERLAGPLGLAVRLQRGGLIGWSVGVAVTGLAYGSIANSIEQFVSDNAALSDVLTGGSSASLIDAYLGTSVRIAALVGAGFAVQATLRARGEETAGRAEPVLATAVSRTRWALGHLAVAGAGTVIVLTTAGLATGISAAVVVGDAGLVTRLLAASLAYAPALWLLCGCALALVGVRPRAVAAVWGLLIGCFVISFLGPVLQLPGWVVALSPFDHVPLAPAEAMSAVPLVTLAAIAAGLVAVGIGGIARRDIG